MDIKLIHDRRRIRYLSEHLDYLIKKAVKTSMRDPDLENEIRELNEMLKSLDKEAANEKSGMDNGYKE